MFVVGNIFAFIIAPHFTSEAVGTWLKMAEWACYSVAWMGLPVGLLVALSRYRLYEADAAISRSLAYLLVTLIMVGVFGAINNALTALGTAILDQARPASAGCGAPSPPPRWSNRSKRA